MATGLQVVERAYQLTRGDDFVGDVFRFLSPVATMWTGKSVRAQLRQTPDGPLVHEFDLSGATVTSESGETVLTLQLQADGDDTQSWLGRYVGDLEISSPAFPKMTVVRFTLDVQADITHDDPEEP